MMHKSRHWCMSPVTTAEDLARMLTEQTWTLCSGFHVLRHEEYVFLNDATHEDGAGEFACCRKLGQDQYLQVESITFSWCDEATALRFVRSTLAGEYDRSDFAHPLTLTVETPDQHGRCHLCM